MRRLFNFSFFVKIIISFILLGILYIFLFTKPVYREPVFYFIDNKILFLYGIVNIPLYEKLMNQRIQKYENLGDTISVKVNDNVYNFHKERYNFIFFIKYFDFYILLSFYMILFAIIFYEFFKDIFLSFLYVIKTLLVVLFLHIVYYNSFSSVVFWNLLLCIFIFVFLNVNLKFLGKTIPSLLLLFEFIIVIFYFSFVIFSIIVWGKSKFDDLVFHNVIFINIYFLISLLFVIFNFFRVFYQEIEINEYIKILVYIIANILGIIIPYFVYMYNLYNVSFSSFSFYFYIYPLLFFYVFYRSELTTNQIIVTRVFTIGLNFFIFGTLYFFFIFLYDFYFPNMMKKYKPVYDIFFLVLLSVFLEPIREKIYRYLKKKFIIPEKKYINSLMVLSQILSRISRPNFAIIQFLDEVKKTLEIEKCLFMIQSELLPNIQLDDYFVLKIESNSKLWKEIKPEKIIATPYIIYSTGIRKELFNTLYSNNIFLCIGLGKKKDFFIRIYIKLLGIIGLFYRILYHTEFSIYKSYLENEVPKSALLVGYPSKKSKFSIREIYYLQEVARLATMMFTNMHILLKEVDKRKKIRFINLTGKFQKQLTFEKQKLPNGIEFKYFSKPVISVSGDYIDIIPYKKNYIYCFLGDMSGHGLGTGYLVSAVRSIVHHSIQKNKTLVEIVNTINLFLTNRYQGYEFLTLFAFLLNITDGKMEYINAAHPCIYIMSKDDPLFKIEKTQKVLGITEIGYESYVIQIKPNSKIFVFSDGVIETFNKNNEIFGEQRLYQFLMEKRDLKIDQIVNDLYNYLQIFRDGEELHDDTTFLAIEYNPPKPVISSLLDLFFKR